MFSAASKMCFSLGWWTVVAGALYAATTGDRNGFTLLVFAGLAAAALGLAVFGATGSDADVRVTEGATPSAAAAPEAVEPARASVWPLLGGVAFGLLAVGAAVDVLMPLGIVAALIVAGAWFAQVWREHPSWTPEMNERLNDRFVMPIGLPLTVIALAGIAAISFSRVLLAVSKEAAVWLALGAAVAILGACAYVASRPRMARAALGGLAGVSALLVLASGIAGAVKGERQFHTAGAGEHGAADEHAGAPEGEGDHGAAERGGEEQGGDSDTITVVAREIAFEPRDLDLPARTEVNLVLDNRDSVPHNVSLYRTEGGQPIFQGRVIEGHQKTTYHFSTPEAGVYVLQCDVHPVQMKGRAIVAPESSSGPPTGGNVTTTSTSAP